MWEHECCICRQAACALAGVTVGESEHAHSEQSSSCCAKAMGGRGRRHRTINDPAGERRVLAHADRVQPLAAHRAAQAVADRAAVRGRRRPASDQRRRGVAAEAVVRAARPRRRAVSAPAPTQTRCASSPAPCRDDAWISCTAGSQHCIASTGKCDQPFKRRKQGTLRLSGGWQGERARACRPRIGSRS